MGGGVAAALLVVLGLAYYMMQPGGKGDAGADKASDEKVAAMAAPGEKGSNPLQKFVEVVGVRVVTVDKKPTARIVVASVAPNGSVEVSAPFTTKLKPYEMPDWQNLTADLQITSPKP